ncbi:MAG: hypothetical protein U1F42_04175 [Candidatus Competibacteraceae bacterium]
MGWEHAPRLHDGRRVQVSRMTGGLTATRASWLSYRWPAGRSSIPTRFPLREVAQALQATAAFTPKRVDSRPPPGRFPGLQQWRMFQASRRIRTASLFRALSMVEKEGVEPSTV